MAAVREVDLHEDMFWRGYSGEDVSMKVTLSEAIIVEEDVSSVALIMSPGTATPLKLYLCTPIFVH